MEPPKDPSFHWQWWHIVLGFLGLTPSMAFKKVREFLFGWIKNKVEEDHGDCVKREELEALRKDVKDEIHFIHQDLSDKISANAAMGRQDRRDDRQWMESQFKSQWDKLDGLTTQILLNQKNK